jgi:hypothetical protein
VFGNLFDSKIVMCTMLFIFDPCAQGCKVTVEDTEGTSSVRRLKIMKLSVLSTYAVVTAAQAPLFLNGDIEIPLTGQTCNLWPSVN